MHISWLGHSAFKIETKTPLRDDVTILINPYNGPKTDLPRNLKSDITLLTSGKENTITLSGEPFIIDSPGEYEVKGVMIYAVPINGEKEKQIIYHLETESMSLIYFGDFHGKLTDETVEKLGSFDVLLIPCGNSKIMTAKEAAEIVNQLEPRIVVPHSFNPPGRKDPFEAVDSFAKLLGQKEKEWLPKFKITKKDLPQEETKLILLEKV